MKKLTPWVVALALWLPSVTQINAQTKEKLTHEKYMELFGHYLKERAEKNLAHLIKDSTLRDQVVINDKGIQILEPNLKANSITMYWEEAPGIINILESSHQYDLERIFRDKKHHEPHIDYVYNDKFFHHNDFPFDIRSLRIAIDPGHFGGTLEEAKREARFVNIAGADLGQKDDVKFFEADLTYATSVILRDLLYKSGAAEVMLTRPNGSGAMGKTFSAWMKASYFYPADISSAMNRQEISEARANQFIAALKDTTKEANRSVLFDFYRYLDFRERVIKINQFQPDITISIHYNASEDAQPSGPKKQIKPTKENNNIAFIPGAFMYGELNKLDQHIDFLRLLLSPEIEKSASLSSNILIKQQESLKVPIGQVSPLSKMSLSTVAADEEGVYSRNLYMLRATRSTITYNESFYQNNINEALLLAKKDYKYFDGKQELVTSSRVKENAEAIHRGILAWLSENKTKHPIARK